MLQILQKKMESIQSINFLHMTHQRLKSFIKNTDLIIAANAICHIPNLKDMIKGVDNLLTKKGFFIFEGTLFGINV